VPALLSALIFSFSLRLSLHSPLSVSLFLSISLFFSETLSLSPSLLLLFHTPSLALCLSLAALNLGLQQPCDIRNYILDSVSCDLSILIHAAFRCQ
jgi:hypothetical protein